MDDRWDGVERPYSYNDVKSLRDRFGERYVLAERASNKLWKLMKDKPYVNALGAMSGNQAMQMARAGLQAIYVSGWQCAADANIAGEMYPDQSLYPANSVPLLVKRINGALKRCDQIDNAEGKDDVDWLCPIVADAEAGFGGPLNAFELMKGMIKAGAAAVHFEDQLSSEKKCGHLNSKCLVPTKQFVKTLIAARLASDVLDVPTILIARTDAESAGFITSDIDPDDHDFILSEKTEAGKRTPEGFFKLTGNPMERCVARGLAYAPYADMLWMETSTPDLEQAKRFADAIHEKYPGKLLTYNCFGVETAFITKNGVKAFTNFNDGDHITVLTHKGNWERAVVRNYGKQKLQEITLQKGASKTHTVRATKNHRWLLSNGEETTNLQIGNKLLAAPFIGNFDFDNASPFEKLYWCYGYVYGDGTKWKKNGEYKGTMVRLCNRDAKLSYRFEEVGFKTSTNLSLKGDFYAYTGSYLKTLPDLNCDDPALIKAFVNGWLQADGAKAVSKLGTRYKSIQQTGEERVSFLRRALPMSGFYITREDDYSDQVTNFGPRSDITIRFTISYCKPTHNKKWKVIDIFENSYEEVWCLEVENDASLVLPFGVSTGNCSPSFNWKDKLDDETIAKFQTELGKMGYKFQFITLAGFHSLNMGMFNLAKSYKGSQMAGYSQLQEQEFAAQSAGYTAVKHQREVGVGYFDKVRNVIDGGNSSMSALKGSTEDSQF